VTDGAAGLRGNLFFIFCCGRITSRTREGAKTGWVLIPPSRLRALCEIGDWEAPLLCSIVPRSGLCGEGARPIYANLTSRYSYPASVLVYFNHLAWSLPVAFCKIFCNEIPAFETFTQRQNRIYCAPEQTKCKRCLPPQIRLGGIFFTDVRATIPLPLEYAGVFLIPERRWGFLSLVCAEGIPRGKKNVLARQLQR
jgi:hypothetical protein